MKDGHEDMGIVIGAIVRCLTCGADVVVKRRDRATKFCSMKCYNKFYNLSIEDKFFNNVIKTDDCWIWTGVVSSNDKGRSAVLRKNGIYIAANKIGWEIVNGSPPGQILKRRCLNKICVNPSHMYQAKHERKINIKKLNSIAADKERKKNLYLKMTNPVLYRSRVLLYSARSRSKKNGQNCDLVLKDVKVLLELSDRCACCQIKLDFQNPDNIKTVRSCCASLDRIDNKKGYIKENIRLVCFRCNALKRDSSTHDITNIINYIRDFLPVTEDALDQTALDALFKYKSLNMFKSVNTRVRLKHLPKTEITRKNIWAMLSRTSNCLSCGTLLKINSGKLAGNSSTLDRVDPSKGYVLSNVCILCFRCNAIKKDSDISELTKILEYSK